MIHIGHLLVCILSVLSVSGQEHYVKMTDTVFSVNDVIRVQHEFRYPLCTRYLLGDPMEYSMEAIDEIVGFMRAHPEMSFCIEVHTDTRGSAASNARLSQSRSETIRTSLIRHGGDSTHLTAKGLGESRPLTVYRAGNEYTVEAPGSMRAEAVLLSETFVNTFRKSDPSLCETLHQYNRRTELRIIAIRKPGS